MSIQSEITRISQGVAAAKTAVTSKGGTVSTTSIDDLASEIATIPSGGQPEPQDNLYGMVTYMPNTEIGFEEPLSPWNCELEVVDQEKWNAFLLDIYNSSDDPMFVELRIMYSDGEWIYEKQWETYPLDQEEAGVELTFTGQEGEGAEVSGRLTKKYTGIAVAYVPEAEKDLEGLCSEEAEGAFITVGNQSIDKAAILMFDFGDSYFPAIIGDNFLSWCTNLLSIRNISEDKRFTSIGDNFLSDCEKVIFNDNVSSTFATCTTIGSGFLARCNNINGTFNFSIAHIPNQFLAHSTVETIVFYVGSNGDGYLTAGDDCFFNCDNLRYIQFDGTMQKEFYGFKSIGDSFCQGCGSLQRIDLYLSRDHFLANNATSIGSNFFAECPNFKGERKGEIYSFIIPSTVTSIGGSFLREVGGIATLTVNTTTVPPTSEYYPSLGGREREFGYYYSLAFQKGITLDGTAKNTWKNALPDLPGTMVSGQPIGPWRKLILA